METIAEMLRLIEDASLFILNYGLRSSWGECLLATPDANPPSDCLRG
jgi:hypothetical protein